MPRSCHFSRCQETSAQKGANNNLGAAAVGIFKASSCLKMFVGEDSLSANMTCCMLQTLCRHSHRRKTRSCSSGSSSIWISLHSSFFKQP